MKKITELNKESRGYKLGYEDCETDIIDLIKNHRKDDGGWIKQVKMELIQKIKEN